MCNKRRPYRPRYVWDLVCVWCRVMFRGTRDDAKYCSPAHRQAAYRDRLAGGSGRRWKSVTRRSA
jgi:hypothetical protein